MLAAITMAWQIQLVFNKYAFILATTTFRWHPHLEVRRSASSVDEKWTHQLSSLPFFSLSPPLPHFPSQGTASSATEWVKSEKRQSSFSPSCPSQSAAYSWLLTSLRAAVFALAPYFWSLYYLLTILICFKLLLESSF